MKSKPSEPDDIRRSVLPRTISQVPLDEADTCPLYLLPKLEGAAPLPPRQSQFKRKIASFDTMEQLVEEDTLVHVPNYFRNGHTELKRPLHVQASSEEESLSRLATISMLAVRPRDEVGLQNYFINARIEEIVCHETEQLPIVEIAPIRQGQAEKRQVIASTASGAAIAGIGDLISSVVRYGTNVVMTHIVTQSIYGIFVETNALVTILGYASKFGLDSATLRFLSTYRAKGERSLAAGLIRFASVIAILSGLLCAALFFLFSSALAHLIYHKEVYELPFKEAALLIPLIGMQLVIASGLQALKAIKWKVYMDRLIQPGLTLVSLLVFYALGLRLEALILATICGYLGSTIVGQVLLRKAKKNLVRDVTPRYEPKTWVRFAFPMFFNSMIRNILNSTDVLFLGALATTSQVGLYGAADRVSYFVVAPLIALNVVFSPIIAELHSHGKRKQLENMFKVVTKWSFSLSWPVFLCCLVFHDAILGVFGEKYIAAGIVLIILAFGNLVDSGVGSVNYLLVMTGRPRIILLNTVSSIVVNVSLALILIPRFSIEGAAWAAALTVIVLNLVGLIEVYLFMGIHPYRWDILKPVVAGAIAALVGLAMIQGIHVGFGHLAILGVLGLVIPFTLVYVSVLVLFRFDEEDMMVIGMVRAKFVRKKVVNGA